MYQNVSTALFRILHFSLITQLLGKLREYNESFV